VNNRATWDSTCLCDLEDHYRVVAPDYDLLRPRELDSMDTHLRTISVKGSLDNGMRILDVGCGNGRYLSEISTSCRIQAVGLDCSAAMLSIARQRNIPEVEWLLSAAENATLESSSFNLAYSIYVEHQIGDLPAYFSQISRALKLDGIFILVTCTLDQIAAFLPYRLAPGLLEIECRRFHGLDVIVETAQTSGLNLYEMHKEDQPPGVMSPERLAALIRLRFLSVLAGKDKKFLEMLADQVISHCRTHSYDLVSSFGHVTFCFRKSRRLCL